MWHDEPESPVAIFMRLADPDSLKDDYSQNCHADGNNESWKRGGKLRRPALCSDDKETENAVNELLPQG
jgi:hypothetical protein